MKMTNVKCSQEILYVYFPFVYMHICIIHAYILCPSLCIYVAFVDMYVCETLEFHAIKFAFLEQLLEFLGFDKIHRHK